MKDTFKIWNRIWQRSYSVVNTAPSGASGVPNFNARRGTNRENDFEMGGILRSASWDICCKCKYIFVLVLYFPLPDMLYDVCTSGFAS